ncbi:MAG: universal stress protein A [Thiotrichaceae bacterium]|nr:MAG: universal stress protein A [Thiotrichaceae bacterium]
MNNYKYILLATDFSKPARAAAQRAAKLASCFNARLCLLHVVDHFPEDIPNEWIAPENQNPAVYLSERSIKALEQLSSQLEHDNIETHTILSEHSAAHEITQYATQNKVDLIVIGHHGHHGISNVAGSTSSAVVHRAECDTLSVQSF